MSKSTPGPWEASSPGMDYIVTASDGRKFIVGDAVYHPENEANARLIAAAPDLLRACKRVADMAVSWQPLTPGDIAEVKAAIAKAEGR